MNGAFFIYSITPIAIYGTTINLNLLIILLGILMLVINLVLFWYLRKITKCERDKMLSIGVLNLHSKQYSEEFQQKTKEIREVFGDRNIEMKDQNNEEYNNNN